MTSPPRVRPATIADVDALVELMVEFYAESGHTADAGRARAAFAELVADESLGRVWLLLDGGETAGYVVLALGYSLEFLGRDAFVDDLFVRPAFRGRGLGRAALEVLFEECRRRGVRAVHLEVGRDNHTAKLLYHGFGFRDHDRQLLTRTLDDAP